MLRTPITKIERKPWKLAGLNLDLKHIRGLQGRRHLSVAISKDIPLLENGGWNMLLGNSGNLLTPVSLPQASFYGLVLPGLAQVSETEI